MAWLHHQVRYGGEPEAPRLEAAAKCLASLANLPHRKVDEGALPRQ